MPIRINLFLLFDAVLYNTKLIANAIDFKSQPLGTFVTA